MRRCAWPAALLARAVPITSVVSARRGCTAASNRIWVRTQRVQRARLGRISMVWAPRLRTRRRRPYPHRVRMPSHPGCGQPIPPVVRACSAHSWVRTTIIGCLGGHKASGWSTTLWMWKG